MARAHMTGGVMDRLPGEAGAAPVAAAAEAEADEEADPPAAGTAGGPLAIAPGPGPPPRDPAALDSLAARWRPARPCHAAERNAGPGTRAPEHLLRFVPAAPPCASPSGRKPVPPSPRPPTPLPAGPPRPAAWGAAPALGGTRTRNRAGQDL